MSETRWHLFVDESGDLDVSEGQVVVAGVGLRLDRLLGRPDQLKEQLIRLVPGVPWPLHLSVVKRLPVLALAPMALRIRAFALAAGRDRRALASALAAVEAEQPVPEDLSNRLRDRLVSVAESGLAAPVDRILAAHREGWRALVNSPAEPADVPVSLWASTDIFADPPEAASVIAAAHHLLRSHSMAAARVAVALAGATKPDWSDLTILEQCLAQDENMTRVLCEMRGRALTAVRRIVSTLAETDSSGFPGTFLVVAGESHEGDFHPPGDGSDRYLSLLESLLVRVGEVLARWPGRHAVEVRACTRYVLAPWVGSGKARRELDGTILAGVLKRICGRVGGDVELILKDTPRYGNTRDPGFVLADFAANACRLILDDRPLTEVESNIKKAVGAAPRSGEPSRTHVQAAGEAWRLLDAWRCGEDPPGRPMRAWAREQALEWVRP